jgi:Ca2+/Na+ antiporter
MFPMLVRDGLRGPYYAVCAIFFSIFVLYLEEKKCETQTEQEDSPKGAQSEVKKRSVTEMRVQLSLIILVLASLAGSRLLLTFLHAHDVQDAVSN